MIWKYKKIRALCTCEGRKELVDFTTICPMSNPVTAEEGKAYHDEIDKTLAHLSNFGFYNFHVLLLSHNHYSKETMQDILKDINQELI